MLKRLLIFLIIAAVVTGGLIFYGWYQGKDSPTKDWSWYRSQEFKYRLRTPPGWLVEEKDNKLYLVTPEEKQAEAENLAVCLGEVAGDCDPERQPRGIFVAVFEKSQDQDLVDWFEEKYKDYPVMSKEEFVVRIIKGLKAYFNGPFKKHSIFLAQPSYVLELSQYLEESPELDLTASSVQLPEEREIVGSGYYAVVWVIMILAIYYFTRLIARKPGAAKK